MNQKKLSQAQIDELLKILSSRFAKHVNRHPDMRWDDVQSRLENNKGKLWSLNEMEASGGEPDVVDVDDKTGEIIFFDCSPESPKGRRSICYDRQALESRKKYKPDTSAVDLANEMGIEILTENQYFSLQELGNFDNKTSSWVKTPPDVRKHGGAIFGDYRFGRVFIYHNGADSYYGARGFRGSLKI